MISESVVIISDLHLGDARKSAEYEQRQLLKLGRLLQEIQPTLVLNLGDTVSRPEYLRPGLKTEGLFADYLRWRKSTGFPFMECMIEREKNFFEEVFHQSPDDFRRISDRLAVIALAPTENNDHAFRREQLTWLQKQLKEFSGSYVLIGTHVPFEGACSRPAEPGNYLERTPELDRMIREAPQQIFWAGIFTGHRNRCLPELASVLFWEAVLHLRRIRSRILICGV